MSGKRGYNFYLIFVILFSFCIFPTAKTRDIKKMIKVLEGATKELEEYNTLLKKYLDINFKKKIEERISKYISLRDYEFDKFNNSYILEKGDFMYSTYLYGMNLSETGTITIEQSPSTNCAHATSQNGFNDGIYPLIYEGLQDFYAYCIHEESSKNAWTVMQRRSDSTISFNRNWKHYKLGFGNLYGDYWIGLERLHVMTTSKPHELWIQLETYDHKIKSAKYTNFKISSEEEGYKLSYGSYSGDAGDSLQEHKDMKFSSFDKDNDLHIENCAAKHSGGWWFNKCFTCNLNGLYRSEADRKSGYGEGVMWKSIDGSDSLKRVFMAIRPQT